jgi:hypothetical protein
MLKSSETEKTTKFKITKKEIVDLLIREAGLEGKTGVTVKFECTGGYTPAYDRHDSPTWSEMDLYSVSIIHTEKNFA